MLKILNCDWKDSIFKFKFDRVDKNKFYSVLIPIEHINSNTLSFSYSYEDKQSAVRGYGRITINLFNLTKRVDNNFSIANHAVYYDPSRTYFKSIALNQINIKQEKSNDPNCLNEKLNIEIKKTSQNGFDNSGMNVIYNLYLNEAYLNNSQVVNAMFIDWNKTNGYKFKTLKFNIENFINKSSIELANLTELNKETMQVEKSEYGQKGIVINPYIDTNIEVKISLLIDDIEFEWILAQKQNNQIDKYYLNQNKEELNLKTKYKLEWEKEIQTKLEGETYEKLIRFIAETEEKIN